MPTSTLPQVLVKFADSVPISLGQGNTLSLDQLANIVGSNGATAIDAIRQVMPDLAFRRHFDVLSPDDNQGLIGLAKDNDPSYTPPNFETYLEVVCPADFDTGPLITAIQKLGGTIEFAETINPTEDAGVVGTGNPDFNQQGYLFAAPIGIGVQAAWTKGADGTSGSLIDIEHGWFLGHEDLPRNIAVIDGIGGAVEQGHGTAVLGVVGAIDNGVGVVGIAPATVITLIAVADSFGNQPLPTERIGPKIALAASNLAFGDVILLEVQQEKRPVELDSAVFKAIQLATSGGKIVVEAGGNAGVNLDNEPFLGDSGAIVVGACAPGAPHSRWDTPTGASNFGNRIDCYAWGGGVHTTGLDTDPVQPNSYFDFSGTSAAAAIIAGICLLIQHLRRLNGGMPLHPLVVRDILRNTSNGTDSAAPFVDRIGVMPNFLKIIPNQGF
jgi:hypothetical protein